MKQITMIGVDLAKTVFQRHGVDANHRPVPRRQLRRAQLPPFFAKIPPCSVVMEACGTAHHWAREIGALGRRPKKVVIVALANKLARIAWAIMAKGTPYRAGTIEAQAGALA